jgi:hypothetical protein
VTTQQLALSNDLHTRRDWLDVLRGELPPMVPTEVAVGHPPARLFGTSVVLGLLIGAVTGAICGAVVVLRDPVFVIFAVPIGAYAGVVTAVAPSLVLGGAITVVAARAHTPFRDPRRFHRHVWAVLLAGVGALDLAALAPIVASPDRRWAVVLAVLTAIVLLLLRWAAREIVVSYAEACGSLHCLAQQSFR